MNNIIPIVLVGLVVAFVLFKKSNSLHKDDKEVIVNEDSTSKNVQVTPKKDEQEQSKEILEEIAPTKEEVRDELSSKETSTKKEIKDEPSSKETPAKQEKEPISEPKKQQEIKPELKSEVIQEKEPVVPPKPKVEKEVTWYKPEVDASWHWQLNGKINMNRDVDVYIIDLFDTTVSQIKELHKKGKKVIGYFSAGSYEKWRSDSKNFSKASLGKKMDGWDERWIDIRNKSVRDVMLKRLDLAKKKGFDGIEADNVDGYVNKTGFPLKSKDQLNFNIFLAKEAHKRGLAIALKNDVDQIKELEPYFDFHINEECHQYDECDKTLPFIRASKPVFNAEYTKKRSKKICKSAKQKNIQTLILPLELDDSFRMECD